MSRACWRGRYRRRVRLTGRAVALTVLLYCLSGCGLTESRSCTLIGCESGLTLVLAEPLPDAFSIEVRVGGERRELIECSPASPCGSPILLAAFVPELVEIVLTTDQGSTTSEFRPEYVDSYPNGPECDPSPCRQGRIVVRTS